MAMFCVVLFLIHPLISDKIQSAPGVAAAGVGVLRAPLAGDSWVHAFANLDRKHLLLKN